MDKMSYSNRFLDTDDPLEKIRCYKLIDFERDIWRIEEFVHRTVDKLTFAMTIPRLWSKDNESIKIHLNKNEWNKIQQVFKKYSITEELLLKKQYSHHAELLKMSLEEIENYFNTYSLRKENVVGSEEYDLCDILNLLYNNKEIRKISETHKNTISEAAFHFLQDIKLFLYSSLDKMKISPEQAESRELYLRKLSKCHLEKTDEAHLLFDQVMEQVKSTEKLLRDKFDMMTGVKKNIEALRKEFLLSLEESSGLTRKRMTDAWKESEEMLEELDRIAKEQMVDINGLRSKFVLEEKKLRSTKSKTEQRLAQLLRQYDNSMQTKQNELDHVNQELSKNLHYRDELMRHLEVQKEHYDILMEDKELEDAKIREYKCKQIRSAIAARKIQRYYRYMVKLTKGRLRKGFRRHHLQALSRSSHKIKSREPRDVVNKTKINDNRTVHF